MLDGHDRLPGDRSGEGNGPSPDREHLVAFGGCEVGATVAPAPGLHGRLVPAQDDWVAHRPGPAIRARGSEGGPQDQTSPKEGQGGDEGTQGAQGTHVGKGAGPGRWQPPGSDRLWTAAQ